MSSFCVNLYCVSALALFKVLKSVYIFNTHHVIISRFYLNALVQTYCYQFRLFTLSLLLFKISYYFSMNCHLNGHTCRKYLDDILQGEWNINVTSKLFEVQPIIKRSFTPMERRRDDVVLCRARIGHAYFTNGYLLRGELRPMCGGGWVSPPRGPPWATS